MSESKINAVLVAAYLASGVKPEAGTAFEGVQFEPVTGESWARITDLPASREPAGMGRYSPMERVGVLQIDIFHPKGSGTHPILSDADKALGYFRPGRRLSFSGQGLRVDRSERGQIKVEDLWQTVRVSVRYTAWTFPLLTDDEDLLYAGGASYAGSQTLPAE